MTCSEHSSKITDSEKVCLAYPARIEDAPIKAYEPIWISGLIYSWINTPKSLPNPHPIKIPDTKRPRGKVNPTEGIANKYQIMKYISKGP